MAQPTVDKELEQYRNLLETPKEFRHGFGWTTVAGIFFCGLVMLPGSIYLGLMTGGGLGAASTWVTVILFAEIARRAMKTMNQQELVVLLHAAGIMIAANAMFPGGPFGQLVWRAYLVGSDAVRDAGMSHSFPAWFTPPPESEAILERNLFHRDWLVPIGLIAFMTVVGMMMRYTLGYFFFRLTSDIENLPFPFAGINAQGAMALAEMDEKETPPAAAPGTPSAGSAPAREGGSQPLNGDSGQSSVGGRSEAGQSPALPASASSAPAAPTGVVAVQGAPKKKKSTKWRLFSFGAVIGIAFGMIQVGIPAITGLIFDKPLYLIPQPFLDTTTWTEAILPATPTGMNIDLGIIFVGTVIPFWAVIGTFIAIAMTLAVNPILHHAGVLTHWQPGMNTINAAFSNSVDFWMSFGIGAGLGIAAISIYSTVRDVMAKMREMRQRRVEARVDLWATPKKGRGDYPLWLALACYVAAASTVVVLCHLLVPQLPVWFLCLFAFLYNPFISYVNARLLGIAGQSVDIPFVKETAFILCNKQGIDIWLAPIPIENYGYMAQAYRTNELTGVNFWSLIKADIVAMPILFILSGVFWAFVWYADPVPSDAYPFAQVNWEYASKNTVLVFSSTFVAPGEDPAKKSFGDSQFRKAIHEETIGIGAVFTIVTFALLSAFGLPVMLVYGFVRGLGQLPHYMVLEIVGALIGRFYLQKKYGSQEFLRMAPTVLAGYFTGVGLISMGTIALKLIKAAVSSAPF